MINVFEKAALDMKAEGLNVELKKVGWHLFEKSNLTLEHRRAAIRAVIERFPDSIIGPENRPVHERKSYLVADRKSNDPS